MQPAKILEITSYPPPRAGWGVRVEHLKRQLEAEGHQCVVLNIGTSRRIPSTEYETVANGWDYLRKVVRFVRAGFTPHIHVNGASEKGLVLSFIAEGVGLLFGRRPVLTFHAGIEQVIFPRSKAPRWAPVFQLLFAPPSAIICNSEEVKAKIVEYGVRPSKVVPIPAFSRQYLEDEAPTLPPPLQAFYGCFTHVIFCYIRIRPLFYPLEVVQGFAQLVGRHADVGLVLCGTAGHTEGELWPATQAEIERSRIGSRVLLLEDLDHPTFLAALRRASLYLRSHVSDGVCSSVLEALSLGVPVVASENQNRPPGVRCYPAADPSALADVLAHVLEHREQIARDLESPQLSDTVRTEVNLLTGTQTA
jgi:glycosyltransferase involved in cell wall biosynthesis